MLRRPFSFAPWYQTCGWGFKGVVAYLAYYWLINSNRLNLLNIHLITLFLLHI